MVTLRVLLCGLLALAGLYVAIGQQPVGQDQQSSSGVLTLRSTSQLVFMDVTVLDRKGRPVVKGLTRDDFTITEDKKPETIFSFEPPQAHLSNAAAESGKAPVTIFVLDRLNSQFEDFAFISYSIKKYLRSMPKQLDSPSELMVLGNNSLEMVQNYTRSRDDLLYAVDHIRPALPYKMMNGSFFAERFVQSMDALQQIALQSNGVPGRKNIVWIGHGGPNIDTTALGGGPIVDKLNLYVHNTTNLLVDARISLFVLYPGLPVNGPSFDFSNTSAEADPTGQDPFAGDIGFSNMVNATGGTLFYNRNDVDTEIRTSEEFGSNYYTLTYQPQEGNLDGKFRRIRVTLRDPNLHVVTKVGYYAPEKAVAVDPRRQGLINIYLASQSTIPFTALDMTVEGIVRHPDTDSVAFTVVLKPRNISWQPQENGTSTAQLLMSAASLSSRRDVLASRLQSLKLAAHTQDPAQLQELSSPLPVTVRFPRKAQVLRVAVEAEDSGRTGTVELDRKTIAAAPEAPTPAPPPPLPLLPRTAPPDQPGSKP
jgi:VWFA-related protein